MLARSTGSRNRRMPLKRKPAIMFDAGSWSFQDEASQPSALHPIADVCAFASKVADGPTGDMPLQSPHPHEHQRERHGKAGRLACTWGAKMTFTLLKPGYRGTS